MNEELNALSIKSLRVILLTALLFCYTLILKGQDFIRFSPLTAQQIEHCEGDQYYVHFTRWGLIFLWEEYVFSALQHNSPVKSIKITNYEEHMVYDEPTMVENKKKSGIVEYQGDHFVVENDRLWQYSGFSVYGPAKGLMIIEAKNRDEIKRNDGYTVMYNRDENNRVTKTTCYYSYNFKKDVHFIVNYTYWANTDFINTIKCYDYKGKIKAEVNYYYLTIGKKTLLNKATCKLYESNSYASETYIYQLNYDVLLNVDKVELFFEENQGYKKQTKDMVINVNVDRDKKGNIKKCICNVIKYEEKELDRDGRLNSFKDEIKDGFNKTATWFFDYDDNNNWTAMTRAITWNGEKTKYQIKRDLVFNTSQSVSKEKSNPTLSSPSKSTSFPEKQNSSSKTVVIDGSELRLRLGPSLNSNTFKWPDGTNRHPKVGEKFKYLGESGDFYKIDFNGNELWVSKQFTHIE